MVRLSVICLLCHDIMCLPGQDRQVIEEVRAADAGVVSLCKMIHKHCLQGKSTSSYLHVALSTESADQHCPLHERITMNCLRSCTCGATHGLESAHTDERGTDRELRLVALCEVLGRGSCL